MPDATPQPELMEFRTEVQQLLNILANSLYTEREIFLRELISNASDALNRLQFQMLTDRDVLDPDAELAIEISIDEEANSLTISDTGIGMNRDELIENLGTIAHSGAMAFLKGLEEGQRSADIIGQFGVGFYAVFMVAEEVVVTTRSYRIDEQAWQWSSRGDSKFTLVPAEKAERGTTVEVKLREDAAEFASSWRVEQIVKKHSDYVSFPIKLDDRVLNQQTALWRKSAQDLEDQEYADFYRQLTLDYAEPLVHIHMVSDVPVDIHAVLFVPRTLNRDTLQFRREQGLRLYSRKILIQEHNRDLLPDYLDFVAGVVDSEDIPLNISREMVQSSRVIRQIQKALTSRVLRSLKELADENADDYRLFWEQFGPFIKQGIATNPLNNEDLLPLLRFRSSTSGEDLISLADYLERAQEEQGSIYYLIGHDLNSVATSPHLDSFKARNLEVLYFLDPLDGFLAQSIGEFEGKKFQNVDDPDLELPAIPGEDEADRHEGDGDAETSDADFLALTARFKRVLGDRVTEVRESKLLTNSPCRLVTPEAGPDRDLQRFRRLFEEGFQVPPKMLELNRSHTLIQNLAKLVADRPADDVIDVAIEQIFANLLLLEGLHPNPVNMVPRIQSLLETATKTGT